jgi:YVTN family beta-propeller protein
VIDTATDSVIATIPVGNGPRGIAVSPDGARVYVTHSLSNVIYVIDTATNTVINKIDTRNRPTCVAVSPDGTRIYLSQYDLYHIEGSEVSVIDIATNAELASIQVPWFSQSLTINPEGTYVYVATGSPTLPTDTVTVIDTSTNSIVSQVTPMSNTPTGVALNPDGTRLYVTLYWASSVAVIDTATTSVIATVPVHGNDPWVYPTGVTVSPDGTRVYVADSGGDCVSVIDTSNNTLLTTIQMTQGIGAYGIAVHPDGTRVYVTNSRSDTVTVIDTATNTIVDTVKVGSGPGAFGGNFIATTPIVSQVITATAGSGGSISPSGDVIVNYGESQLFSIIPDKYYRISDVIVNGVSVGSLEQYTFEEVTNDHIITATFALTNIAVESPNGGETLDVEPYKTSRGHILTIQGM